ncbi:hypothetical protein FRC08_000976 [Ceratobasidium sp. 394]|nr:hypothetical protein FRC08_000976 [Ceratobasidium sp. 394]KAG9100955.1 hypothetical protein FS749_011463 [Ceratobasidium sp. UAMH 11750]
MHPRSWVLVVLLGICQSAYGWSFLTPLSVVEGGHISFQLINNDGGGYNFPYTFTIYNNGTGKDEQVNLQYVSATPFFWDNNQPVGAFLKFRIVDVNNFVSTTDYVQVSPNPTFVSSMSVQSTASVISLGSTLTRNTNSVSLTPAPTGIQTSTATAGPVKTNVGAIAGGVVGGVLILATIVAAAVLFLCRRRKRPDQSAKVDLDEPIPPFTVTPFTFDNNTNVHSSDGTISQGGTTAYAPTLQGGPSSYAPSEIYAGQHDAPPIYSPPMSPGSSSTVTRGYSQRKGAYAPVSTVPH